MRGIMTSFPCRPMASACRGAHPLEHDLQDLNHKETKLKDRLKGKRAIVTGAASGIGRAGALLFASEGASVVAVDRDRQGLDALVAEIGAAGGHVHALAADLTQAEQTQGMVHDAAQWLGGLDVFWGNAGMNGPTEFEQPDLDLYDTTVALNLTSTVLACAAAAPLMRTNAGGSIVLTASTSGLVGSIQSPVYSVTKFGVIGLAKSLALKYGAENIRVNAVCPGPIETPLLLEAFANRKGLTHGGSFKEQMMASVPMSRVGRPSEIAEAALWLASDASSYVTGVALPVDGGLTAR